MGGVGGPATAALTRRPPWPASLSALYTVPHARAGELFVLERWARTRSLSPCGASASATSAACRFERWPLVEEIRRFSLAEIGGHRDVALAVREAQPVGRGVVRDLEEGRYQIADLKSLSGLERRRTERFADAGSGEDLDAALARQGPDA